ncbi:MAG: hypothetical protein AAGF30_15595 [Pseudomonadota bacterium]
MIDWLDRNQVILFSVAGVVCLIALAIAYHRLRLRRRMIRQGISGLGNGPRFRLVDAVCHAVWQRGKVDERRLKRALEIARDVTDMNYDDVHIRELVHRADRLLLPFNFRWMRADLSQDEKLVIFNAAASVMLASGRLSLSDQRLLRSLSRGLGLKASDLRDLSRVMRD